MMLTYALTCLQTCLSITGLFLMLVTITRPVLRSLFVNCGTGPLLVSPLPCSPSCHPWLLDHPPLWLLHKGSIHDKCRLVLIHWGRHGGSPRTYLQLFNHGGAFHLDLGNGASIWRPLLQNKMKHENVTVK